jgi:ABC-type sugar transport system ATPase subunit
MSSAASGPILTITGVRKNFGGIRALIDGRLVVNPGEVHALLGENGAGKSTLVKILAGALNRDDGEYVFGGTAIPTLSVHRAEEMGIRLVYQHVNVIDDLTVGQNLLLGRQITRFGIINGRAQTREAVHALARLGIELDPRRPASTLRPAEKQLVEIARALRGSPRVLLLDEPTASLGEREVERLFGVIRSLRDSGMGIVFISHKLDEVFRIADRVTVMRDARTVHSSPIAETTPAALVELMVGRSLARRLRRRAHGSRGDLLLEATSLTSGSGLRGVSFTLHRGEVLGVYGLLGSGRSSLLRALFGADRLASGTMCVAGTEFRPRNPSDAMRAGIGLVSEERWRSSFPPLPVRVNLSVASFPRFIRRGFVGRNAESSLATDTYNRIGIRAASVEAPMNSLSGGNQQKVVVGRWLLRGAPILLLDDPTSGVDVGAKEELYALIQQLTQTGTGVVLTSSELSELLAISDRILVLRDGASVGLLEGDDVSDEAVLHLAATGTALNRIATPVQAADPGPRR